MRKWLPPNVSTYGAEIDTMFVFIYYLTGIVFLLVALTMLWFVFKYRDRGDGRRAIYSHGNTTLEIVWTVVPAIIFLALAVAAAPAWHRIKIAPPEPDVVVGMRGKQFNWVITYPGPDRQFGTKDDKTDENYLRVPVNKVVHLELGSEDVIHSFFVPQLRLKQDMLPGRKIIAWFEATQAGVYEIACAELCGFGHTTMAGKLFVLNQADYDQWVEKRWPGSRVGAAAPASGDTRSASLAPDPR